MHYCHLLKCSFYVFQEVEGAVAGAAVVGVAARQALLGQGAVAEAGVAVMAGAKTCHQLAVACAQLCLYPLIG